MSFKVRFLETLRPLAIALGALWLAPSPLTAATVSVCPVGCDASTFQAAIVMASTGDTVQYLATLPHTEAGIVVTKSLTIKGLQGGVAVIQGHADPGSAPARVLTVQAGVSVLLRDLTIQHGFAMEGGGILNLGTLTTLRVAISDNEAGSRGGGISNQGILHLIDSTVSGNRANVTGGGIYNDSQAFALLERTLITTNHSAADGGALYNKGTLQIVQCLLHENTASWGAGVYNQEGALTIERTMLLANRTLFGDGGAAHILSGALEITSSWFHENWAEQSGAGIALATGVSTARISNTTFTGNLSVQRGGALYTGSSSAPRLDNVTMAYNRSGGDGGAIYVFGGKGIKLASTTVVHNTADQYADDDGDGGGLRLGTECSTPICVFSWATIKNTLIASNLDLSPTGTLYNDCLGDLTSEGFNIVADGGTGPLSNCRVVGDLTGVFTAVTEILVDLADHGGQTTWFESNIAPTFSLYSESLAVDNGNPSGCRDSENNLLTRDQRYAPRVGTCDIGAFEFLGAPDPPDPLFSDGFESGSRFFWQ